MAPSFHTFVLLNPGAAGARATTWARGIAAQWRQSPRIQSSPALPLAADGESLPDSTEVQVQVLPGVLRVVRTHS